VQWVKPSFLQGNVLTPASFPPPPSGPLASLLTGKKGAFWSRGAPIFSLFFDVCESTGVRPPLLLGSSAPFFGVYHPWTPPFFLKGPAWDPLERGIGNQKTLPWWSQNPPGIQKGLRLYGKRFFPFSPFDLLGRNIRPSWGYLDEVSAHPARNNGTIPGFPVEGPPFFKPTPSRPFFSLNCKACPFVPPPPVFWCSPPVKPFFSRVRLSNSYIFFLEFLGDSVPPFMHLLWAPPRDVVDKECKLFPPR